MPKRKKHVNVRTLGTVNGMNLPLRELPTIKKQSRKKQAKNSLRDDEICGADTETLDGKVWLFSTEYGVWEVNSFGDLLKAMLDDSHLKEWERGKNSGSQFHAKKGYSVKQFFYWNLQFDSQAMLKWLDFHDLEKLLNEQEITIFTNIDEREFLLKIKYLEGKYLCFDPLNLWMDGRKVGKIEHWDISQFYNKMRLNTASKIYFNETKLETTFDGYKLDVSMLGQLVPRNGVYPFYPENFEYHLYHEYYREDIEKYAVLDAILAGKLARRKKNEFVEVGVRFTQPYSLANVAQRNLLDMCKIPTINGYLESSQKLKILNMAWESYIGGHFETIMQGYLNYAYAVDLASAYPYIMYHLVNTDKGHWLTGSGKERWLRLMNSMPPYSIAFAEIKIKFCEGKKWNPLCSRSGTGTIVTPRFVKGVYTMDEIREALEWDYEEFYIGEFNVFVPDEDEENKYPFRPFLDKFYKMKVEAEKGSAEYDVSKVLINSIYGKLVQKVNQRAGKLFNPLWGSVITGATRARLAKINRLNGYSAVSFATDGVIFPHGDLVLPQKPLEGIYNLGDWEEDGDGELIVLMSGVYSMRKRVNDKWKVKTTFRGSASYFLRPYLSNGGIFKFCEDKFDSIEEKAKIVKPYSAGESRVRNDFALMNIFAERSFTLRPFGDSTKRRIMSRPTTFGDLLNNQYETVPYNVVPLGRSDLNLEVNEETSWRVLSDEETNEIMVEHMDALITDRNVHRIIGDIENVIIESNY